MSADDIPSGHGVRERLLVEIDTLRKRYLAQKQAGKPLTWWDNDYWVDQERGLVMPFAVADELGFAQLHTAPESQVEELEYYSCRKAITTGWDMIRLLAAFISGTGNRPAGAATDFLNLAVVQPLVNPPFEPLFWLGLAWQIQPNRDERNLGEALGGMAFDLSTYPASQAEGPDVRRTQVEWVKSVVAHGLDLDAATRAREEDWASQCKQLMDAWRQQVDNVFFEIAQKARRMRTNPASP